MHYGRASLSELSRLPAYYVFARAPIDLPAAEQRVSRAAAMAATGGMSALLVLMDQPYAHALPALQQLLSGWSINNPTKFAESTYADGQQTPAQVPNSNRADCVDALPVVLAEVLAGAREPSQTSAAPEARATLHSRPHCGVALHTAGTLSAAEPGVGKSVSTCSEHSPLYPSCACRSAAAMVSTSPVPCESQTGQSSGSQGLAEQCSQRGAKSVAGVNVNRGQRHALPPDGTSDSEPPGSTTTVAGLRWSLPDGVTMQYTALLWIGDPGAAALTQLQLTYNQGLWASYDPATDVYAEVRRCPGGGSASWWPGMHTCDWGKLLG